MNSLEEGETILLMLKSSRTEITVGGRLGPQGTSRLIPCLRRSPGGTHRATALCWCAGTCGWAGAGQAAVSGGTSQAKCPLPTSGNFFFFHLRRFTCASRNVSVVSKLTAPFSSIFFFLNLFYFILFFTRLKSLSLVLLT